LALAWLYCEAIVENWIIYYDNFQQWNGPKKGRYPQYDATMHHFVQGSWLSCQGIVKKQHKV